MFILTKRWAIIFLLLLIPSLVFGQASTGPNIIPRGKPWSCFLSALSTTKTQCQALSTGITNYITAIVAVSATTTAATVTITFGTGTACATVTTTLPAMSAPASSTGASVYSFHTPLVPTQANAICATGSSATNTVNLFITGFQAP